jgi:LPPG:FO 2-phospho-L-lactate transferase
VAVDKKIVVLVGGVGGAKLAYGLAQLVAPEGLTIIVNTADDFWHYGLKICPDMDTLLYTLSGRIDPINGWGVADDTTVALETLRWFGEDTWFRLGDKDLAIHLLRTHLLRQGQTLTQVVALLSKRMGVAPTILPMTDDSVATVVETAEHGELEFQDYFVRHRWQPRITGLRYAGIDSAQPTAEVLRALRQADMVLLGPSNPWLSIMPILELAGIREQIQSLAIPRVALTPIVQGQAIKGPAAKIMQELGYEASAAAVAEFYGTLITGFVYDTRDNPLNLKNVSSIAFDTMMKTNADKVGLAQQILDWITEGDRR